MYLTYLMQGTQYVSLSRLLLLHFITASPTYLYLHNSYNRFHFISFNFISFSFQFHFQLLRAHRDLSFSFSFPFLTNLIEKVGR